MNLSKLFSTAFKNKAKGQININGQSFVGNNITVTNNEVLIDGKPVTLATKTFNLEINIHGDCEDVDNGSGKLNITGNTKNVDSGSGSVNIGGNVNGSIDTGSGSVVCGSVSGNIKTGSGSVNHRK